MRLHLNPIFFSNNVTFSRASFFVPQPFTTSAHNFFSGEMHFLSLSMANRFLNLKFMMPFCVCFVGDTRAKNELRFRRRDATHVHVTNKLIFNRYLRRWEMTLYSIQLSGE